MLNCFTGKSYDQIYVSIDSSMKAYVMLSKKDSIRQRIILHPKKVLNSKTRRKLYNYDDIILLSDSIPCNAIY